MGTDGISLAIVYGKGWVWRWCHRAIYKHGHEEVRNNFQNPGVHWLLKRCTTTVSIVRMILTLPYGQGSGITRAGGLIPRTLGVGHL